MWNLPQKDVFSSFEEHHFRIKSYKTLQKRFVGKNLPKPIESKHDFLYHLHVISSVNYWKRDYSVILFKIFPR